MNTIEKQAEEYCLVHAEKDWGLVYAAYLACASAMNGSAGVHWVRATDRLPEKSGVENSVIIRHNNRIGVEYAFKNFDETNPQFYYSGGLTLDCEWLDESVSSPSPLEAETADKKRIEELEELVKKLKAQLEPDSFDHLRY